MTETAQVIDKKAKTTTYTLKMNGDLYDNMIHKEYKTGDVVDEITPFLQAQINEGLVELV